MADPVVLSEMRPPGGEPSAVPEQLPGAEEAINRRIFETSVDLILVVDRRGRLSASARAPRRSSATARKSSSGAAPYPPDLDNTREEMRWARRHGETRYFECRYVHRDGHPVPLAWTGFWSKAEQQHFFIGRDITERLEAEARLRQSQKMEAIGNLTGRLAHDFNNLLGVIIGNLDMAKGNGGLSPENAELVADALDAALRGAELTRRLLAFARRQKLDPADAAINDLVGGIVGFIRRTLGEDISIVTELAGGAWSLHASRRSSRRRSSIWRPTRATRCRMAAGC